MLYYPLPLIHLRFFRLSRPARIVKAASKKNYGRDSVVGQGRRLSRTSIGMISPSLSRPRDDPRWNTIDKISSRIRISSVLLTRIARCEYNDARLERKIESRPTVRLFSFFEFFLVSFVVLFIYSLFLLPCDRFKSQHCTRYQRLRDSSGTSISLSPFSKSSFRRLLTFRDAKESNEIPRRRHRASKIKLVRGREKREEGKQ